MKRLLVLLIICFSLTGCTSSEQKTAKVNDRVIKKAENQKPVSLPPKKEEEKAEIPQVELVPYNGPIEHIFFHPLVVYPQLAFDGDNMAKGYDDWFVTVSEFNKIVESLYERNYILIKMSDLFEEKENNGEMQLVKRQLKLPAGKKPLILSVDDINYYPYMLQNGNVYKLFINKDGKIASYSKDPEGKEVISEENEIVPLLNSFVDIHPDFSLNGAKGILALTGYEGVLGYRTNQPAAESEREEAKTIIAKLKEEGWEFASHGYGHLAANTISLSNLKRDADRWKKEVEPLTGSTNIYIYPFGSSVLPNDPKFKYLETLGFKIFCSVGPNAYLSFTQEYAMMDRVHIDGMALEKQRHIVDRFFDSSLVLDNERFKYKSK